MAAAERNVMSDAKMSRRSSLAWIVVIKVRSSWLRPWVGTVPKSPPVGKTMHCSAMRRRSDLGALARVMRSGLLLTMNPLSRGCMGLLLFLSQVRMFLMAVFEASGLDFRDEKWEMSSSGEMSVCVTECELV